MPRLGLSAKLALPLPALALWGAAMALSLDAGAQGAEPAGEDASQESEAREADPADARLAEARAMFREGLALMTAGDFAAARGKFLAVAEVRMTAQVAFNLAECEENLGMLRAALGNYRLAASRTADGSAPKVSAVVDARIADVEKRIPHLTLRRGAGAAGATITLDGLELGAKDLEADLPLDPGSHVVILERGGKELARRTFTLGEGQSESIVLEVSEGGSTSSTGDTPTEPDAGDDDTRTIAGVVLLGAGAVSLGAGVVFLILRQGTIDDLDEVCTVDDACPPSAESTADRGRLYTGLAEITIPLGVIGAVAGIVLLATGGSDDEVAFGPVRLVPGIDAASPAGVAGMTATVAF